MAVTVPPAIEQFDLTKTPFSGSRKLPFHDSSSVRFPEDREEKASKEEGQRRVLTGYAALIVALVFTGGLGLLAGLYYTLPDIDASRLKLPRDLDELRVLKEYLSEYSQDYELQVMLCFFSVYVFMMTFACPGTIFLSILAGALFGFTKGLLLVLFTATMGASSCYFMSHVLGRTFVTWMWPGKVRFFTAEVKKRKANLFNYMLVLRVTPILPNTFINVASPIVDIPYSTFAVATFIGLIPAGFLAVRAGLTLGELKSIQDLYDIKSLAMLFLIGAASLIPALSSKGIERDGKQKMT